MQKVRKFQKIENTQASLLCMVIFYLVEQLEVRLSQFEWNSRDSPTETWLTDRYRFFVIRDSRQFPVRRDRTVDGQRRHIQCTRRCQSIYVYNLCSHTHIQHYQLELVQLREEFERYETRAETVIRNKVSVNSSNLTHTNSVYYVSILCPLLSKFTH